MKPFLIAEAGSTWAGDPTRAAQLIRLAAEAGEGQSLSARMATEQEAPL